MSDAADPTNSSRYFKLGLFIIVGTAVLIAGVVVLGAGALFRKTISAETLVYESVNGLEVGSPVKYRGVPVGKVTAIIFASQKYPQSVADDKKADSKNSRGILVEMALDENIFPGRSEQEIIEGAREMVKRGMRARITAAGISGQSFIDCDILNPEDHPPLTISWTPDNLYLPSAPSALGQVLDAAEQIAMDLKKARLDKVVGHIDELATEARTTIADVDQVIHSNRDNISKTVADLPDTVAKLRSTVARADQILHDPSVDKAVTNLAAASESAKVALVDIRNLARDAQLLLSGESDDLRSILTDLRKLAADGAAITDDAKQNPSRLLFGKPPERQSQPVQPQGR